MIFILEMSREAPSLTAWVGRWKGPFSTLAEAANEVPEAFHTRKQYSYYVVKVI